MKVDGSAECLVQLLKQLNIPVTSKSVYEELEKHPDYPSLLALSDVLHTWGVPNSAYRVHIEELKSIPPPFIAHTLIHGADFILIKSIDDTLIRCEHYSKSKCEFSVNEFKKYFTGNILLAKSDPNAGELHHRSKKRKEQVEELRTPFIIVGCLILFLIALYNSVYLEAAPWQTILLLAAKSVGVILTILLLIQSLGISNSVLQHLCTSKKNTSCTSILASNAAKLIEEVSWSEVGFLYFSGTWLALITLGDSARILSTLALVTLISLLFTGYSLYYQTYVARKWCVLCSGVQAVLWIEFIAIYPYLTKPFIFPTTTECSTLLGCLLAPLIGWVFVKPFIAQAQQAVTLQQKLKPFKRNQQLFHKILAEQPRYELLPATDTIHLGNREARNIITVVSSPSCSPCARTHQILEEWLMRHNDLQAQIVFAVPANQQDMRTQVASHLMALNHHCQQVVGEALRSWYSGEQKQYDNWVKRYPIALEVNTVQCLQKQRDWCHKIAVMGTPTILLNGKQLPEPYQLEDIRYFL